MAIFDFLKPLFRKGKGIFPLKIMQVVVENPDGTRRTAGWHLIKPPDHFPTDGSSHIGPYIERLVAFEGHFASLSVFSPDEMRGFGLHKMDGEVLAGLMIHWREEPEREKAARDFFSARGIDPADDYLGGNGDVHDAVRVLDWPLPVDADSVTSLSRQILRELCGIEDHEALNISYEETK